MTKRQMRLGLSMRYLGYHDAAWRHPDVPAGGSSDYHHFLRCARRAEEGLFDLPRPSWLSRALRGSCRHRSRSKLARS